jgi:hypothetical protein
MVVVDILKMEGTAASLLRSPVERFVLHFQPRRGSSVSLPSIGTEYRISGNVAGEHPDEISCADLVYDAIPRVAAPIAGDHYKDLLWAATANTLIGGALAGESSPASTDVGLPFRGSTDPGLVDFYDSAHLSSQVWRRCKKSVSPAVSRADMNTTCSGDFSQHFTTAKGFGVPAPPSSLLEPGQTGACQRIVRSPTVLATKSRKPVSIPPADHTVTAAPDTDLPRRRTGRNDPLRHTATTAFECSPENAPLIGAELLDGAQPDLKL